MRRESIAETDLDNMLYAYCGRTAQEPFKREKRRKVFITKPALCLVLALFITVVMSVYVVGLSTNRDNAPAKKLYAFSVEKLAAFSKEKTIQEKTARKGVGAWQPCIEYADGNMVVFTVATGAFVFDYQAGEFINTFDLEKIGVPAFAQGDSFSTLTVSMDGKYGLLYSCDAGETSGSVAAEEYRELDLKTGAVKRLDSEDEFFEKHEPYQVLPADTTAFKKLPGFAFGGKTAVWGGNEYLIALDWQNGESSLGSMHLVIMNSKTGDIKSLVSIFDKVK